MAKRDWKLAVELNCKRNVYRGADDVDDARAWSKYLKQMFRTCHLKYGLCGQGVVEWRQDVYQRK